MFASCVVALNVVSELKDVELCTMAIIRAGDALAPAWRYALTFVIGLRRWTFLPMLLMSIPLLVAQKGGCVPTLPFQL